MSCRVAMLSLQEAGLIHMPEPRWTKPPPRIQTPSAATDPPAAWQVPAHQLGELQLRLVEPAESRLWNDYIARYHYLGWTPLPGAQLRYFVTRHQVLALLGFGAAAWQVNIFGREGILYQQLVETKT